MILECLRHGRTANNLANRFNSEAEDILPEERGRLSVVRLATRYDLTHVSPLPRAVQTAQGLGLANFVLDARLAERRFGTFEGLTPDEYAVQFPDAFKAFSRFDAHFAPPEGKSRQSHHDRVRDWLREVATAISGRVLAVTHGGVIDLLYRLGTNTDVHGGPIHAGSNLGLSRFEIIGPDVRLLSFPV